ncbi:MAG: hypothetical protein ACREBD_05915 [Blastocatellia bacterium]
MLSPGTVLQKRYRIKRLLAQGGMGAVYEAEAVHLRNAPVAVKETFFNDFSNENRRSCASSSSARRRRWLGCIIPRCRRSKIILSKATANSW